MKNQITIREAAAEEEALFLDQLRIYFERDIFSDPQVEGKECFSQGSQYWVQLQEIHNRPKHRCHYLFFCQGGKNIGFAMPVLYKSEDGKCFLMEFCVFPEYRGHGIGKQCVEVLLKWAKENGGTYVELNYGKNERRLRFWKSVGFVENGANEWGEPLMILPPEQEMSFSAEILNDPADWQLVKLENGFLAEIGEENLSEEKQELLQQAIQQGTILFFIAKRGYRSVGMCSVSPCFSTFSCTNVGVFDDFFIEPAFRKKGIARMLAQAAQNWCKENGISSLTVCCAPCDEGMYQSLGFSAELGATFAHLV